MGIFGNLRIRRFMLIFPDATKGIVFMQEFKEQFEKELAQAKAYVDNPDLLKKEIAAKVKPQNELLAAPSPDEFSFRMMRYRGYVRFPERLKNKIKAEKSGFTKERDFLPMILDVEPTSRCNFRCIMCQLTDWKHGKRADDLGYDDFVRLIDSQYGLVEVKLQGMGEPLLNKDFFKMAEYLSRKDIWVRTTVNGSLLHLNDNYKKLVDVGIGELTTSFDGATKEVFEKIRKNSDFDVVVKNLTDLNAYADSKGILLSRMWVLIQHYNVSQVFDFVDLAEKMRFKRMTFSIGMSDFGQEKWRDTNKSFEVDSFLSEEEIIKLKKYAEDKGIDVTFWDLAEKYSSASFETMCKWPFTRAYVSSDLRIVPCCMIGNPDVAELGDARAFTEEWNSPRFQGFREAHLKGAIPGFCKNCYIDKA